MCSMYDLSDFVCCFPHIKANSANPCHYSIHHRLSKMSSSAFEKTYEKYCVYLYQKEMDIYTMKHELINLQSEIKDQNCEHSIQYILDLQSKIKVIWEKLRKISSQMKVIETSIQMLERRFFISNHFY